MIRNLKPLLAAALVLTALGAIAAGAHAAEEFHCSVNPCRVTAKPDGTGKTAHQVFVIENETTTESVSFTCESLSGEGEVSGLSVTAITLTTLAYKGCTANSSTGMVVSMNGCDYNSKAAGGKTDSAKFKIECPAGKKVEFAFNGCIISVAGGFESPGVGYATIGEPSSREGTITVNHVTIPAAQITATGTKAQCLINTAQALTATYTTGNTLITGENTSGTMANVWFE